MIARINRKLKPDLEALKTTRGWQARLDCGDHYIIDYRRNFLIERDVDLEAKARELGVLAEWEAVSDA